MFGAAILTVGLMATAKAQSDALVGTWNCSFSVEESGSSMTTTYERIFRDDGSYAIDGSMTVAIAQLDIDLALTIDAAGKWRVDGSRLLETLDSIEVASESENPNQIEQMIVGQMRASMGEIDSEKEEESTIVSVTATTLELDDDGLHSCQKDA
jgi:hypothetical protein